jgi:hypothetical protein
MIIWPSTRWTLRIVVMACAMSLGGCGAQGLIEPALSSGLLGGLGGGGTQSFTLSADSATNLRLSVGQAPAAVPIVTVPPTLPVPPVDVPPVITPGGGPVVVVPPFPVPAPTPVPTVP